MVTYSYIHVTLYYVIFCIRMKNVNVDTKQNILDNNWLQLLLVSLYRSLKVIFRYVSSMQNVCYRETNVFVTCCGVHTANA